jgi:hypothetical protein
MSNETSKPFDFSGFGIGTSKGQGRVDEAMRTAATIAILARGPVQYISQFGVPLGQRIAKGEAIPVPGGTLTINKPDTLKCAVCGKTHGKPSDADVKAKRGWRGANSTGTKATAGIASNHLFVQNGVAVIVSNTCVTKYVTPNLTAKNCTNFAEVVAKFGQ